MRYHQNLPRHLRSTHDLCLFLHDELLYAVLAEGGDRLEIRFSPTDVNDIGELQGLSGERLWDWLDTHGHTDITDMMTMVGAFRAVVSDLCLFLLEGLRAAEKLKMTVAFALLRKPLTENLYYLEWLLADPVDFVAVMKSGSVDALALSRSLGNGTARRRVEEALARTEWSGSLDPEWIFSMRYSKEPPYEFQRLFHQALHMVTTHQKLTTEPHNLNFVFSDHAALLDQQAYLYSYMPLLLDYAFSVVRIFAAALREDDLHSREGRDLRRLCGWAVAREDFAGRGVQLQVGARKTALQELVPAICCPSCESTEKVPGDFERVGTTGAVLTS
jgi:hypothetical protein